MAMSISDAHKALDKEYYKACADPAVKEPVLFALDKVFNKCGKECLEAALREDIPGQMNIYNFDMSEEEWPEPYKAESEE